MSLLYIIDAYNLINHPRFKPPKKSVNIQHSLADFIRFNNLSGSKNNEVTLVFDGYPSCAGQIPEERGLSCVFSQNLEADELIKRMVEGSGSVKNIIVVSDDKEVQLMTKFLHARAMGVEEFIRAKTDRMDTSSTRALQDTDPQLTYSQRHKIDEELKKKWLK